MKTGGPFLCQSGLNLNEVDDDEILLKKNRMSRSLVLDTPEVADAAEEDFLDTDGAGEEEYDNIFYD